MSPSTATRPKSKAACESSSPTSACTPFRKHGFMANWAWLLLVCLGHNLCCWVQELGRLDGVRDGGELRAKRFRYRYLVVPAMVVRGGPRLTVRLSATYPFLRRFLAVLGRLRRLAAPTA